MNEQHGRLRKYLPTLFPKTSKRQTSELIDSSAAIVGFPYSPERLGFGMPNQVPSQALVRANVVTIHKVYNGPTDAPPVWYKTRVV